MAITVDELKRNVFPGESGGDYNALFGYANRPGGQFSGVNLTDMTVDQALQFANPSGPYGQSVKGQIGRVATPMGAYQVVGTTLRGAKEGLGLTGNEVMTPQLQDAIGMWIYQNQGPQAWEAWGGGQGGGNVTRSSKGTGMGLLDMQAQQPQTFGQKIGEGLRSGSLMDNLALAFNSLRMNPDQGLAAMVGQRQEQRGQEQAANRTAQWLRSRGHDDLASALEAGSIDAGSAVNEALARERPADPMAEINLQKAQLELQNLQNPQPGFRDATPEEAARYGAMAGQFDNEGKFYPFNPPSQGITQTITNPDGTTTTIQVGGTGQGVGGGKPPTEGQLAGAGYLQRMTAAESILRDIETRANVVTIPLEKTLLLGTGLEGYTLNPVEQQVAQAQRDWVRAKLRKESGAVIGPEEMAAEIQTYFPMPGEGQETIAQKAEARRRAERQMQIGAGSAAGEAGTISPSYSNPLRMDELVRRGVVPGAGGGAGQPVVIDGVTIRKVN